MTSTLIGIIGFVVAAAIAAALFSLNASPAANATTIPAAAAVAAATLAVAGTVIRRGTPMREIPAAVTDGAFGLPWIADVSKTSRRSFARQPAEILLKARSHSTRCG